MAIFSNEEVHTVQGEIALVLTVEYNPVLRNTEVRLYDAEVRDLVAAATLNEVYTIDNLLEVLEKLARHARVDWERTTTE